MKLRSRISMSVALATGVLAVVSTAAAGGVAGYRDAGERGSLSPTIQTSISGYVDANERSRPFQPAPTVVSRYLDASERSQAGQNVVPAHLIGYVDAAERGRPVPQTSPILATPNADSGFEWGAAAVGASSALMLAFLVGASLLTVRQFRNRPLAGR